MYEKRDKRFYTGDTSAYWSFMKGHPELPQANPDLLAEHSEESTLSNKDEEKLQAYARLVSKGFIDNLTKQQRVIWKLAVDKLMKVSDIAIKLKLSKQAVYTVITRVAKKIRIEITKELRCEEATMRLSKKQEKIYTNNFTQGFQKVSEKGKSNTDDLFNERLEYRNAEIEAFIKQHPSLRRKEYE